MKKEKFKDDGKTRRCQEGVFHSGRYYCGHHYSGYATQCENGAKHDKNTRCNVHSRASVAARKAKKLALDLAKARVLIRKHG